jgi:polyphosphate glucokinase
LELGHLEIRGKDAEKRASDLTRAQKDLSWAKWARRVNEFLARLELYFSPDLFVIGGGVSKNYAKFGRYLQAERAKIVPAQLLNEAGIVGAAMAAVDLIPTEPVVTKAAVKESAPPRPARKRAAAKVAAKPRKKPAVKAKPKAKKK